MKRTATWIVVIIVLLIGVAGLTVILPNLQSGDGSEGGAGIEARNDPVTVILSGYLLGDEIQKIGFISDAFDGQSVDPIILLFAMTFIVVVGVAAIGVGLIVGVRFLDKIISRTKDDPGYQEHVRHMQQQTKEESAELKKSRPPDPIPEHKRPRRDAIATGLVILLFVAFSSILVFSAVPIAGERFLVPVWIPATLFALLIAAVILAFTLKSRSFEHIDEQEKRPVNWATIWVALSGLVFLGIGTGLMIYVRSLGG